MEVQQASLDVLQKLGRPGFPHGMTVLLVGDGKLAELREIEQQMRKLSYSVTCCSCLSEARQQLAAPTSLPFDIVLAEASVVSKAMTGGVQFLQTISSLPLLLISSPEGMTDCVWRGIEVGAAEVLEKPLSTHKLQNIWQHVVRKALDCKEGIDTLQSQCLTSFGLDKGSEHLSTQSKQTRSSNMSTVTTQEEKTAYDLDGSFSGSPEVSVDASVSNTSPSESYTVESSVMDTKAKMDWAPSKASKRSHENIAQSSAALPPKRKMPRSTLRPTYSQPIVSHRHMDTVVGMVHPCWVNSQGNSQAYRGIIPPGCVWGTPLNPPPGWQMNNTNDSGPLLGSAASHHASLLRHNSAPVPKLEPNEGLDEFRDLDSAFMGDEFFLGSEFLECDDSFLNGLTDGDLSECHNVASDPIFEAPPIGLALKKSDSLLNLINSHLIQSRIQVE